MWGLLTVRAVLPKSSNLIISDACADTLPGKIFNYL
jgi:hypothetical protein